MQPSKERLPLVWLRNLKDPSKREDFTKAVLSNLSNPTMQRLAEILDEMEQELDRPKESDYENPNWAYKQADYNGARRTLQRIKSIIKIPE